MIMKLGLYMKQKHWRPVRLLNILFEINYLSGPVCVCYLFLCVILSTSLLLQFYLT